MYALELREEDGKPVVQGYVVKYGDEADIGSFRERFVPGSLKLADRVGINVQHDRRSAVSAVPKSATIEAREDGLYLRATLVGMFGRDAKERIEAGILTGLSSEFAARKEVWNGDVRTIQDAVLHGVAIVDDPAYKQSLVERAAKVHRPPRNCTGVQFLRFL